MSEHTAISWADASWNPIVGCTRVSAGCDNCYAIRDANRLAGNPNAKVSAVFAGLAERRGSGRLDWTGEIKTLPERLDIPLGWKRPKRIFVNSQSDLFHHGVPDEFIDRVFNVMGVCEELGRGHVFQVLTKRPARMLDYLRTRGHAAWNSGRLGRAAYPPRNVWLGVSVENQATADERIPLLLQTPAAVRWISAEPLLGPITLARWIPVELRPGIDVDIDGFYWPDGRADPTKHLNWLVVGGESGPNARPMHPAWARAIRDECAVAGVPFHFKQHGAWRHCDEMPLDDYQDFINRVPWRSDPGPGNGFLKLGKHRAGRLLDGVEHNGYPAVAGWEALAQ